MPLIYSAVARGPVVLAEYAVFAGNFSSVAKAYLSKSTNDGRFAYTVDNHVFSFLAEDGYCYVVVTDEATGRTIPNSFLDKLKEEFVQKYADKGKTVQELGLSNFGKRLKELMEHATQFPEQYSKVASVQKKVDEVKNIMSDNIEKVLSRGEKLDLLVDKTDNLMFEADRFVKSGRALRRKMWWNNLKMKVVMGVAVIMVVLIIFLLICFGSGRSCVAKGNKGNNNSSSSSNNNPTPSMDGSVISSNSSSPQPTDTAVLSAPSGRKLLLAAAESAMQELLAGV